MWRALVLGDGWCVSVAATKAKADLHAVCNDFSNFITDSITFYQVGGGGQLQPDLVTLRYGGCKPLTVVVVVVLGNPVVVVGCGAGPDVAVRDAEEAVAGQAAEPHGGRRGGRPHQLQVAAQL